MSRKLPRLAFWLAMGSVSAWFIVSSGVYWAHALSLFAAGACFEQVRSEKTKREP